MGAACGGAAEPTDDEAYSLVLERVQRELGQKRILYVHPLLIQLRPGAAAGTLELSDFNPYDSLPAGSIMRDSVPYRLCDLTPVGACAVPRETPWLALSTMGDLEQNGMGIIVMVVDGRLETDVQQYYSARLKRGLFRWSVVGFTRMGEAAPES